MSTLAIAQISTDFQMENHKRNGFKWVVRGYYGPGGRKGSAKNPYRGRPGEREGDLCMEVIHKTLQGKNTEVKIFEGRIDIGQIDVIKLK